MMVNGTWTRLQVMEFISIRMAQYIKGSGEMINKMAMDMKNGLMEVLIQVDIQREKSTDQDFINGMMEATMRVNGIKIRLMAL